VGPITAKCLADHGATVVRVESENRIDGLRNQPPFKDGEDGPNRSNFFGAFNTSKLGLALDLKTEEGIGVARRLIDWADVCIDSFTPGTMARLGLGYERMRETNPELIMVSTSLMGSGGPASAMAGYGYHAAGIAGFFELVGWPDGAPAGPYLAYTDTIGPRFITPTLLAALEHREASGQGCFIEAAQLEIALQLLAPELLDLQASGHLATRLGNRSAYLAPQGAYRCAGDDQWCAVTVADDDQWSALCGVLGLDDLAADASLASVEGRLAAHDLIDERISAWTAARTAVDVEQALVAAGVPAGSVQSSQDLFSDPQYLHRGVHRWHEHSECGPTPYTGHAYRIAGYDHGSRTAAPLLGEHTFEVLTDLLGLTADEIADLAIAEAIV
ncbi:MAG: CoA transferase, partial [Actinomycetia bacterium]|nr:CoA transferase [Actinomycetes bacterium]